MPVTRASTRERILSAAVGQFAEHGFNRGSLRRITGGARANLAAVNYHFGTKEDLYRELVLPRLRAINQERLTRLAQAEQLSGDQPVPLAAVLDSFVRPFLRQAADPPPAGLSFLRLVSRDLLHPPSFLRDELAQELDPVWTRFTQCLAPILPGITSAELHSRLQFTIGAMLYAVVRYEDVEPWSHGRFAAGGFDTIISRLVAFCAAGMASGPNTGEFQ